MSGAAGVDAGPILFQAMIVLRRCTNERLGGQRHNSPQSAGVMKKAAIITGQSRRLVATVSKVGDLPPVDLTHDVDGNTAPGLGVHQSCGSCPGKQ
jgi:hypothetical protein